MAKIGQDFIVERIVVGPMEVNCYVVADTHSKEAIIIDPGDDYLKIKKFIERNNLMPKFIINTHGHIDHIGADDKFNLPIYIHKLDKDCLTDSRRNLSAFFSVPKSITSQIKLIEDNDNIDLGAINLEVMHTPGHTPGSVSLKLDNLIFTGDTLFYGGVGRTDFPGASEQDLLKSIKDRLLSFADETVIYPGHGPASTIGQEKKHNPFLM